MRDWLWFWCAVLVCCGRRIVASLWLSVGLALLAGGVVADVAGAFGVMWFYGLAVPAWAWVATLIIDDAPHA